MLGTTALHTTTRAGAFASTRPLDAFISALKTLTQSRQFDALDAHAFLHESRRPGAPIVFVNGMRNNPSEAGASARALAAACNRPVELVYNANGEFALDLLQTIADKLDPLQLVHTNLCTFAISERMLAGQTTFVAHSQGSAILRNALVLTQARLLQRRVSAGMSFPAAWSATVSDVGRIKVFAAASVVCLWPPGARVRQLNNLCDPIAMGFGPPTARHIHVALSERTAWGHGFVEVYLPRLLAHER